MRKLTMPLDTFSITLPSKAIEIIDEMVKNDYSIASRSALIRRTIIAYLNIEKPGWNIKNDN